MFLIIAVYFDGEFRSVEGYVENEKTAIQKVEELNCTLVKGKSYRYGYEFVEKIDE